jgi:hypothetical protein
MLTENGSGNVTSWMGEDYQVNPVSGNVTPWMGEDYQVNPVSGNVTPWMGEDYQVNPVSRNETPWMGEDYQVNPVSGTATPWMGEDCQVNPVFVERSVVGEQNFQNFRVELLVYQKRAAKLATCNLNRFYVKIVGLYTDVVSGFG